MDKVTTTFIRHWAKHWTNYRTSKWVSSWQLRFFFLSFFHISFLVNKLTHLISFLLSSWAFSSWIPHELGSKWGLQDMVHLSCSECQRHDRNFLVLWYFSVYNLHDGWSYAWKILITSLFLWLFFLRHLYGTLSYILSSPRLWVSELAFFMLFPVLPCIQAVSALFLSFPPTWAIIYKTRN